jgi:polysaccharide biosynthesis transport protein
MLLVRFDDQTADRAAHLDKAPIVERDATGVQPSSNKPPLTGELHFDQVVAILRRRSSLILTIAGIGTLTGCCRRPADPAQIYRNGPARD